MAGSNPGRILPTKAERDERLEAAERLSEHEPCWMCGTARGLCRHRRLVG
jgi:tRNA(Arg) A34 adenosine deaminase TadA